MGRNRIDHGSDGQARIAMLVAAGHGPERIAAELGVSETTAKRRMREVRPAVTAVKAESRNARREAVRAARPQSPPTSGPRMPSARGEDEVEIPEGSSLEEIDYWLKLAKDEAAAAVDDEDPDNRIKWVRLAASLLEARRKVAPIPKADPNEHPDFVAAAARARQRMHELIDRAAGVSPAHAVCGLILMAEAICARYRR